MIGSEKQIKWAEAIIAEAKESIESAAKAVPLYDKACRALSQHLGEITDSAWIISSRNNLYLAVGRIPGTGDATVSPSSIRDHQLLRNEHWRNPVLRNGRATVSDQTSDSIKALFVQTQRVELENSKLNATTVAAMTEAREGRLASLNSVDDLIVELKTGQ